MENSKEFFNAVSPQYSIITNDKKKMFQDVVNILNDLGSLVYETNNGNIYVMSDGNKLVVKQ